jgi:hypothetical protein
MLFLVSGEGPSDIGVCNDGNHICNTAEFRIGPMAMIVSQVVEKRHRYSPIDAGVLRCVSKHHLVERASELKAVRKSLGLPGKKRGKETRYFFNNARVFARIAKDFPEILSDKVVAVLFRDSDGNASAGRGLWDDKRQSMIDGFEEEGFYTGVPMIPKPKSEAWLICALKQDAYHNCDQLEEGSGNDDSPYSLKAELEEFIGDVDVVSDLCDRLVDNRIDIDRIKMPSFAEFRTRLESVI